MGNTPARGAQRNASLNYADISSKIEECMQPAQNLWRSKIQLMEGTTHQQTTTTTTNRVKTAGQTWEAHQKTSISPISLPHKSLEQRGHSSQLKMRKTRHTEELKHQQAGRCKKPQKQGQNCYANTTDMGHVNMEGKV